MAFDGLRVIAFESRRSSETAELIRRQGGDAFVAPSMREASVEREDEALAFADRLMRGEFDMMILLTGVGVRMLAKTVAARYPEPAFADALRKITVVARGPKPAAALREMDVPVTINVPEPNTWRELLTEIEGRPEKRIAIQEYGRANPELVCELEARGASVTCVRVYYYDLPEDTGPLREAARRLAAQQADVALFTTAAQVPHLFRIAAESGLEDAVRRGLQSAVLASIGPTTSEMLEEFGLTPDVTPSHPKLGFLVKETAEQSRAILERKRSVHAAQ